jgi:16S rRNA (cytidine1402-2'-O)-methyltransferase
VSSPIGNLGDITRRAVEVLQSVDGILCEDTRHSRRLLDHLGIAGRVESLHEHNEARATPRLVDRLLAGERLALISDAGTPTLSDPGGRLVAAAIAAGVQVVPIPGPSALLAALVASGLAVHGFTFLGFLPRKGRPRSAVLSLLSALPHPSVVYEAPTRLAVTLADLVRVGCGDRRAVVARELTKRFEEFRRGTVAELAEYYRNVEVKGEVVLLVDGKPSGDAVATDVTALVEVVQSMRADGSSARDVARELESRYGVSRNEAYRLAHEDG